MTIIISTIILVTIVAMYVRQEKVNTSNNSIITALIDRVREHSDYIKYLQLNERLHELDYDMMEAEEHEEYEKCNRIKNEIETLEKQVEKLRANIRA
jgi:alkyl hydroperoxide reductase subunit AhpC